MENIQTVEIRLEMPDGKGDWEYHYTDDYRVIDVKSEDEIQLHGRQYTQECIDFFSTEEGCEDWREYNIGAFYVSEEEQEEVIVWQANLGKNEVWIVDYRN